MGVMTEKRRERKEKRRERKEKRTMEKAAEVKDEHEPQLRSNLYVWWVINWEVIWIFLGMLGAGISGTMPVILYQVLGGLIDDLSPKTDIMPSKSRLINSVASLRQVAMFKSSVIQAAIWMSIVAACSWAGALLLHYFMNFAHDRIGNRLRKAYFDSLMNQEIGYFDIKKTGQLISEIADMEVITDAMTLKFGEFCKHMIQVILGMALALASGWKMALVMFSVSPLLAGALGSAGVLVKVFARLVSNKTNAANSVANEVISSLRTVRSMDGEEKEKLRFHNKLTEAHPLYLMKSATLGVNIGFSTFCIWAVISLAFWYGGRLTREGEMTTGELFKVFGFVLMSVMGMSMALQILPDFGRASSHVNALLKVIQRKPALRPSGGVTPNQITGTLDFRNINFSYPARKNVQVLKNFSLLINPGQTVALVGASGSGKSTIVGLLERFYAPDSGEVFLDGVNLEEIDPRWIHRNIGIVTQEPTLFACSIRDNIKYAIVDEHGGREVSEEEVINASKAANCHDFISSLPDGYDTQLGERGVSLSGGQKQRIAIARAMIQNPSLLLLDEATSALDTTSEATVQEALNRLMKGRTTIVIAHRLSTIVDSDVIVVMHKGEMKEKGTHQELLQIPDGYYYKLASKQMNFGKKSNGSEVAQKVDQEASATSSSDSESEH